MSLRKHRRLATKAAIVLGLATLVAVGIGLYAAQSSNTSALQTWAFGKPIAYIAFSPDGQLLAAGLQDGTIQLMQVRDRMVVRTLPGANDELRMLAFRPDGQVLASVSDGHLLDTRDIITASVRLWRVADGNLLQTLSRDDDSLNSVAFSPDGQLLAIGGDKAIHLHRTSDGSLVVNLDREERCTRTVAYGPDGLTLAGAVGLAFSPDGQLLAGCSGSSIRLWQVNTGELVNTFQVLNAKGSESPAPADSGPSGNNVNSLAFSPDGTLLASGVGSSTAGDSYIEAANESAVYLWSVHDGRLLQTWKEPAYGVASVAFSPDGKFLAAGGGLRDPYALHADPGFRYKPDTSIRVWNISSWDLTSILQGHRKFVSSVAWNADSSLLASGSEDGTVRLWEVAK